MTVYDRAVRQAAYLAGTLAIVLALFVLAPYFAHELHWLGLRDQTLHFVGHLVVYGAVGAGLSLGLGGRYGWAWAAAMILAGAEELHQGYVPGRCVDIKDYLVNAVAISMAVVAVAGAHALAARWRAAAQPVAR